MTEMDAMKEGFLCPFCKVDMGTMNRLHNHFVEEHSEELHFKKLLRGVMDQAKKIVNKDDSPSKISARKEIFHSFDIYNTVQELGVRRSHMSEFVAIRNRRLEGFAAETNKLTIRLDKLLMNLPTDPARKKMHEQTVVPWIDGEDVSRCPECTKLFHLARRQHHCRLCGSVMCHDCSRFLSVARAKSMLSYSMEESSTETELNAEDNLRICQYCLKLLESRELMKASRNYKPVISEMYDKLRSLVLELDQDIELYHEMSLSLNEGKSYYNLEDAKELWNKIMKLSEKISNTSTKIAALNLNTDSVKLSHNQMLIQKNISTGITSYIQTKILSLPTLPSEEVYTQLQEQRRRKAENEIRKQKQEDLTDALLVSQVKTEYSHSKPMLDKLERNVVVDGWMPDAGSSRFPTDNPIIVQMNNIRSYIKQAREAYKFDEVASLEKNLRELQEEYYRQQNCQE